MQLKWNNKKFMRIVLGKTTGNWPPTKSNQRGECNIKIDPTELVFVVVMLNWLRIRSYGKLVLTM
jgi:hypothetical protein